MLTPPQVQRYARQILVAQVGRAGQERWMGSRVETAGRGRALDAAIEFLEAAGVAVDRGAAAPSEPARVGELLLCETAFADRRSGCEVCLAAFIRRQPRAAASEAAAVAFAVGAGAAAEVLLGLLDSKRPAIAMAFVPEPRRVAVVREGCSCRS